MLGPFFSFQEGCLSVVLVGMVVPCDLTPKQGIYCFLMSLYLKQARTQVAGVPASPYVCGPTNKFKIENRFIWCLFMHTVSISF